MSRQYGAMNTTGLKRAYGGRDPSERIAERRERLMDAAIGIYGRGGPDTVSVTAICAQAGLTTRYFYESFSSHDALLHAVFEEICDRLLLYLRAAEDGGPPAVLRAFLIELRDHPGLAKLFLADFDRHDQGMRAVGQAFADQFASMLAPQARSPLGRIGVIGALLWIARRWIEDGFEESMESVKEAILDFAAAAR